MTKDRPILDPRTTAMLLLTAALFDPSRASAEPAEPAETTRLALLELEGNGVPKELARAVGESVATRADRTGVFETVSPVQIAAVVALDRTRFALGACVEEDCLAKLARAVSAEHAIGGSVGRAGSSFVLQLVLVEVDTAKAVRRVERRADEASKLIDQAGEATIELVQPILGARSGFVRLRASVDGAQLVVDGERVAHRSGQVFALAAGPHVVKATLDGFYPATVDLDVRPGRLSTAELVLVPAAETVAAYNSQAHLLRNLAWISGGLAVASGVAAGIFYARATDDLDAVERYRGLTDIEQQASPRPVDARSDFDTNQGLYLTFLTTAVVTGVTSAALFIFGPDPGRFDGFEGDLRLAASEPSGPRP